jgi:hypothetical protein
MGILKLSLGYGTASDLVDAVDIAIHAMNQQVNDLYATGKGSDTETTELKARIEEFKTARAAIHKPLWATVHSG